MRCNNKAQEVINDHFCFCPKGNPCTREGVCKLCGKPSKLTSDAMNEFMKKLKQALPPRESSLGER